jgi:hypothetical protein
VNAAIGHPDMAEFRRSTHEALDWYAPWSSRTCLPIFF